MNEFWMWWQHLPQHMDPVIVEIGWFRLQYYGMMYVVAFAVTYLLTRYRIGREDRFDLTPDGLLDLMTWLIIGLMIGARLGYVVFYNAAYYLKRPWEIILPLDFSNGVTFTGISGMSYHGGLIGVLLAAWLYCRRSGVKFRDMADLFCPAIPLGYTFGRLGNFINGELYGRMTDHSIGMFFPLAPGPFRRHPSQLYEAFFEGIVLFALLWSIRKKPFPRGAMLPLYLIGYGTARFFIEFARQPDAHLGTVLGPFSMGQVLCGAMILGGVGILEYLRRQADHVPPGR